MVPFFAGSLRGIYADDYIARREEKLMKQAGYETYIKKIGKEFSVFYRVPKLPQRGRPAKIKLEPRDEDLKVLDEGWV